MRTDVAGLAQKLLELQHRRAPARSAALTLGDAPPVAFAASHEWFSDDVTRGVAWRPALGVMLALARSASGLNLALIGRRVWPEAHAWAEALPRCLWVDPPSLAQRLWAIDTALRLLRGGVVLADGSGLNLGATRRVQLAAEAGGSMALLARPWAQAGQLSAAASRWRVEPAPTEADRPRWRVTLLRHKAATPWAQRGWSGVVEWTDEASLIVVPAELALRPAASAERRSA